MNFMRTISCVWFLALVFQELSHAAAPRWRPAPDEAYLQEIGEKVESEAPLTSVGVHRGQVFAGTEKGLLKLTKGGFETVAAITQPVSRLLSAGGFLWAITGTGLQRWDGSEWKRIAGAEVRDLCEHRGELVAASLDRLWRLGKEGLEPLGTNRSRFNIDRVLSLNANLHIYGAGRVTQFRSGTFGGTDAYDDYVDLAWDWGALPSTRARDAVADGGRLYIATDRGLGVLRGMHLYAIRGAQGLCYEDTTCLSPGFANDLWIGTSRGAIRMVDGAFHYFAGLRWLPAEEVRAIAVEGASVYLATAKGLGIIRYEPFTLLKKAAYYEKHIVEWGQKRLGFTHKLEWDDGLKQWVREMSDNDGGYSCDYLAAQSYRFAVTRDPEARREALETFQALRWLEAMTGVPGLPARAVWAKGETGHKAMHGSGGLPAEWNDTADGKFEWKGDTSSDELCGQFYAVSLFLELAAEPKEAAQARTLLSKIAGHLIDHRWTLVDRDGKPTRWGRWDPDYFNSDEGRFDRGLQCLEILSFMKTAEALTGEARFTRAYRELIDLGYHRHTLRQRQTFPPDSILHFEDQLAFWSYWTLLKYEKDPDLQSLYRQSFERTYEILRVEQQPWFNFVYGALTGNECEIGPAVSHLREWPLDLVVWSFQNSHRNDLQTPPGYASVKAGTRPFSPREREPMRWDNWTMKADGGSGGRDVIEPGGWLVAYWMGRYHGFIEAPKTSDPAMLKVGLAVPGKNGAKPYGGPKRPEEFQ